MSGPRVAASLRVWLVLSHLLVLALPLVLVLVSGLLAADQHDQTRADLQNQATLLALLVGRELRDARVADPDADLRAMASTLSPLLVDAKQGTLAAVRVVDADGVVVATSGDELGLDLSDRPEVQAALQGAQGSTLRPRQPATRALDGPSRSAPVRVFLGAPIEVDGATVGAVVLSRTPRGVMQALYQLVDLPSVAAAIAVTVALALLIGRVASRSLVRLELAARRVADGRFEDMAALDRPVASRITEVGALASTFQHMARRLEARMAYITEFAGNVSHEFRTPITTLRGTVELLRDDADMPPAQRARFLDNALAELDRLSRLVQGLLTLARAEQGHQRARVELDALLRAAAARHGLPIEGRAAAVDGQADQLAAVIDNLVDNARRHGGAAVRLRAWAGALDTGFEVVDDGPGMSAGNLQRAFDRFFTTARDRGGTGLGLALVKAIAVAHGGEVTLRSAPGETVARVTLPRAA